MHPPRGWRRCFCAILRHGLETFKAKRKPVPIRSVLNPVGQVNGFAFKLLKDFEHQTVFLVKQSV